ncbi:hypothetical protein [Verrucomicrobium spinosum]|uniref:hypothetical protein n=1 Tax=Verrucomicrobium spinosum TaxID=2736 RepID=UPI0009E950E0
MSVGYAAPLPTPLVGAIDLKLGDNHSLVLTSAGAVWTWGKSSEGQLGRAISTQHPQLDQRQYLVWLVSQRLRPPPILPRR